jgi:hypothetical protein
VRTASHVVIIGLADCASIMGEIDDSMTKKSIEQLADAGAMQVDLPISGRKSTADAEPLPTRVRNPVKSSQVLSNLTKRKL